MDATEHSITGIIIEIFDTVETSSEKQYREFWTITQGEKRTCYGRFNLSGADCNLLDNINIGAKVKVEFYMGGEPKQSGGKPRLFQNNNVTKFELID